MSRALVMLALAACGARSAPPASGQDDAARRAEAEQAERARIVAHHRALESEQQDALGATCTNMAAWAKQQCTPSCYALETPDPRAGTRLVGVMAIDHHVCQRTGESTWFVADDVGFGALAARAQKGKPPKAPKAGTWQADVAAALATRDAVAIDDKPHAVTHPITRESLQCVTVSQVVRGAGKLDACGAAGKTTTCEASGDAAARGLNLLHFRLAEARQHQAVGKLDACQSAALQAIATARGLPRWRQYAKLNVGDWREGLTYATRFDGRLDEDALFARAQVLGSEAEQLHAACGGSRAVTTPAQEHAFHSCP